MALTKMRFLTIVTGFSAQAINRPSPYQFEMMLNTFFTFKLFHQYRIFFSTEMLRFAGDI